MRTLRPFTGTESNFTAVRANLARTAALTAAVALTAACGGGTGTPTATGRPAPAEAPSSEATGLTTTAVAPANPARPGTSSLTPALLSPPKVGANPAAPIPSIVLATSSGQSTADPRPPPNTVSLEDLYRQGQVDISQ